jgi:hypothetical protein
MQQGLSRSRRRAQPNASCEVWDRCRLYAELAALKTSDFVEKGMEIQE